MRVRKTAARKQRRPAAASNDTSKSDTSNNTEKADTQTVRRFRDRIVELRRVPARELRQNPKNFRTHDARQRNAMEGILVEVGWSGATVAFEDESGLVLLDGHLRSDIADEEPVPVLVTDLTPEEAAKVLAAYDALGSLAALDATALDRLLAEVAWDSRDIEAVMDDVLRSQMQGEETTGDGGRSTQRLHDALNATPDQELLPHEHYDYVLVLARTRSEWARLSELLDLHEVRKPRTKRIGTGRCIDAGSMIARLEGGTG